MELNDTPAPVTPSTEITEEKETKGFTLEDVTNAINTALEPHLNDIASLKRSIKKVEKPSETKVETPKKTENTEFGLVEKGFLRSAGISAEDEVELARETADKWGISYNELDKLVGDEDFQVKLEKHRTARANANATANIKGDKTAVGSKQTADYWISQGKYPTREEVPDRKTRAEIRNAMKAKQSSTGKFYND